MDALRGADRPPLPALRLRRPSRGRARHRADGLGRGDRARDRRVAGRQRARRSASSRCGSTAPSRSRTSRPRCRRRCRRSPSSTAPRSPAPIGEPLYLDVVAALREAREAGLLALAHDPLVIGGRYGLSSKEFTPAMVKAVFDELVRRERAAQPLHGRHRRRRDPHLAPGRRRLRHRLRGAACARSSSASARTARSARTRTRSRSSARRRTTTPRATSSTTPRSRGPITISHLRFGPGPIRSSYLIKRGELRGLPPVRLPRALRRARARRSRRRLPPERPLRPETRSGTHLPGRVQEQIVEKRLQFYVIDAYAVARADRHGRPHQHDHADLLLRHLRRAAARGGDRADQEGDREDLRPQGRGDRAAQLRRGRRHARPPPRGAGPARRPRTRTPSALRSSPTDAPTSSSG